MPRAIPRFWVLGLSADILGAQVATPVRMPPGSYYPLNTVYVYVASGDSL